MIARVWHGVTPASKADEYVESLKKTGVPDYLRTDGNLGVRVLRRAVGDLMHFLVISYWDSRDAIHRFAGPDLEKARYYPADAEFLLEFEPTVTHYDVAVSADPTRRAPKGN
jgi:heme-degrading monooxygenase HmoA